MCCQAVIYVVVAGLKLRLNKLRSCLMPVDDVSKRLLICGNLIPCGKNYDEFSSMLVRGIRIKESELAEVGLILWQLS